MGFRHEICLHFYDFSPFLLRFGLTDPKKKHLINTIALFTLPIVLAKSLVDISNVIFLFHFCVFFQAGKFFSNLLRCFEHETVPFVLSLVWPAFIFLHRLDHTERDCDKTECNVMQLTWQMCQQV